MIWIAFWVIFVGAINVGSEIMDAGSLNGWALITIFALGITIICGGIFMGVSVIVNRGVDRAVKELKTPQVDPPTKS